MSLAIIIWHWIDDQARHKSDDLISDINILWLQVIFFDQYCLYKIIQQHFSGQKSAIALQGAHKKTPTEYRADISRKLSAAQGKDQLTPIFAP